MSTAAVPSLEVLRESARRALKNCGVTDDALTGPLPARTPLTGQLLASIGAVTPAQVHTRIEAAQQAFLAWRTVPAPVRGGLVKRLGQLLGEHQRDLADLVTLEAGKITAEALGEVQEMIDVCDFAVGLSRQLYGATMPSERPGHRLMETWHPLGVVGVISAFNFPVAVWSWNAAIALVCGDAVVWKPSEKTPLTALACAALLDRAIAEQGAPTGLHQLLIGDRDAGQALVDSPLVALVSATGSTRMGREVGPRVAARFGRSLLELGGNNAVVVTPSADLDLTVAAVVFAAAGTAGQRCTTLRRLIVHTAVADELSGKLTAAYARLPIGNPLAAGTLVGPLVDQAAADAMRSALDAAVTEGGQLLVGGGRREVPGAPGGYYCEPAIVAMPAQTAVVTRETFAPILYLLRYQDFSDALTIHNAVPQGLSGGIFTRDHQEAERFLGPDGADCGIVNVNVATSGAEIGGAFGGEKETGGGRESGTDAWRAYMRRATNTINASGQLRLAQDVTFLTDGR